MTLRQSLPVLRRWWWVVVAGVVIGVAVGWVSAPGPSSTVTTYQATPPLPPEPGTAASGEVNHAAVLATMGAVPDRVAARLGLDRAAVQAMVSAGTHDNEGEVLITARSPDPAQAEALANDTAEELI